MSTIRLYPQSVYNPAYDQFKETLPKLRRLSQFSRSRTQVGLNLANRESKFAKRNFCEKIFYS